MSKVSPLISENLTKAEMTMLVDLVESDYWPILKKIMQARQSDLVWSQAMRAKDMENIQYLRGAISEYKWLTKLVSDHYKNNRENRTFREEVEHS